MGHEVTTPYEGSPPLTDEQRMVVEQSADALVLVTAGPGTGKTHTMVRRIDHLVEQRDVSASEILVLTFSRAAVGELRRRLSSHGDAARYVRVQTFDSWALELLMEVHPGSEWSSAGFDERIRVATAAIREGLVDHRYEDVLRHVVIDEVQDLVGDRRGLVESLLERYDAGFTLVGDPSQAIYGFQVEDPRERPREAGRFFEWLRTEFGRDLLEFELTENFRVRTDDARTALGLGESLRPGPGGSTSDLELHHRTRTTLLDVLSLGELTDDHVVAGLREYDGVSAILTRTNGQALVVSEQLHRAGVPHRLQRGARDRSVPGWVARMFLTAGSSVLTRDRFDELSDTLFSKHNRTEQVWGSLTAVGGDHGRRSVDLMSVRTAMIQGRVPDELTAQPPSRLIVSSFHRAKGLEFDRVVVADPGPLEDDNPDSAEEARMLYVAMTRARDELFRIDTPDISLVQKDVALDRWGRRGWKRYMRKGLELQSHDVDSDHPAGLRGFEANPVALQEYLAHKVMNGDSVELERLQDESLELGHAPPYLILHGGRPIGIVSSRFRTALFRFLKLNSGYEPRNFPRSITGVWIDAIETVAGSEASGALAGLGDYGVWQAPRLNGLSHFAFDTKTGAADA